MEFTTQQFFTAMYYALDAAVDEIKNDELLAFISNANPFLFKDRKSADRAISEEFDSAYFNQFGNCKVDAQSGLEFVRGYLEEQSPTLLEAFDSIADVDRWQDALDQL